MSSIDSTLKLVVFVGLFLTVGATILTGSMLEENIQTSGATTGLGAEVGGVALGLHAALAGLVALLMISHIVLNRKMLMFHISHALGRKGK